MPSAKILETKKALVADLNEKIAGSRFCKSIKVLIIKL